MRFFNHERFSLSVPHAPGRAAAILAARCERRWHLTAPPEEGTLFIGWVEGDRFRLQPVLGGQNSWRPILRGTLTEAPGGCTVTVTASPHWFVRIFTAVWLTLCLLGTLAITASAIQSFTPWVVVPYLMLLFGFSLSHFAFWREEDRARELLRRLLTE